MISADRLTLRRLANQGNKGAKLCLELLLTPEKIFSTTLLGTSIFVVLQATFTILAFEKILGAENKWIAVLTLSTVSLLFGEILPKAIFQKYAEQIAPIVAPIVVFAGFFFRPLLWLLAKYARWLSQRIESIIKKNPILGQQSQREELRTLLGFGKKKLH